MRQAPAKKAKKRLPRRCFYCEKRFKNAQAVRGHQLHCPIRRLKAQAEAKTEAEPAGGSLKGEQKDLRRPGRESQENKLLLLETDEQLKQLLKDLEHILVYVQFLFSAAFAKVRGNIPPEQWAGLYDDLDAVERDFEQMVCGFRLDQSRLFNIYHRFRAIRESWLQFREHDAMEAVMRRQCENGAVLDDSGSVWSEGTQLIEEDRARLGEVMTNVKRLLTAAPLM